MDNKKDLTENLVNAMKLFSEKTKRILGEINYDALLKSENVMADYMKNYNATANLIFMDPKKSAKLMSQIAEIFHASYVGSDLINEYSSAFLRDFANLQASTSLMASLEGTTSMLKDMQAYLTSSNLEGCVKSIQKAVDAYKISMPDLAFFKTTGLLPDLRDELDLPSGFLSDIKDLNKSSVIRLANNDTISFISDEHLFICENNEGNSATIDEMNAICGAENVFASISDEELFTENELMDFMSYLDSQSMMAMKNQVGQKIYDLIKGFSNFIDFDQDSFYHCRARKKSEPPFIWEQMRKAPYGVTFPGRYNDAGQAFFYCADTLDGAKKEILKHLSDADKSEKVIQSVEIGIKHSAKLLDLSAKSMRGLNVFLKYIRFPLDDDKSKRPRVYLIPSFVSQCCRDIGIEGIKYYGGKEYSNYVTWDDEYYRFIRNV